MLFYASYPGTGVSNSFSQTLRSMNADEYRYSVIGIAVAVFLLVVWGSWFFKAEISLFKTSRKAHVTEKQYVTSSFPEGATRAVETVTRRIVAEFDGEAAGSIRVGQEATIIIKNSIGPQSVTFPASVVDVVSAPELNTVRVELDASLDSAKQKKDICDGSACLVKIEIGQTTPANLTLQASGMSEGAASPASVSANR